MRPPEAIFCLIPNVQQLNSSSKLGVSDDDDRTFASRPAVKATFNMGWLQYCLQYQLVKMLPNLGFLRRLSSFRTLIGLLSTGLFLLLTFQLLLFGMIGDSRPASLNINRTEISHEISSEEALGGCFSYGCPLYPPEVDTAINDLNKLDHNDGASLNLSYGSRTMAMLTKKSNRRKPPFNQDSLVLIDPFQTLWTKSYNSFFMAGTFDGHGDEGHVVSQVVSKELPNRLANKLNQLYKFNSVLDDEAVIRALKDTFVEVDVNLPPSAMNGGCTASVTLRIGSKLFIANTGDSRTIVVNAGKRNTTIVYMNRLDKAHLPDERKRIEGLGGKIHIPPQHPDFSRVVVYSKVAREHIGLAMSRSLGDWEWKAVGVIAEPIVDIVDLTDVNNALLLTASDGLWDMRRPFFFADRFSDSFYRPQGKHPLLTCQDVIKIASPKDETVYRDDISVLAIRL